MSPIYTTAGLCWTLSAYLFELLDLRLFKHGEDIGVGPFCPLLGFLFFGGGGNSARTQLFPEGTLLTNAPLQIALDCWNRRGAGFCTNTAALRLPSSGKTGQLDPASCTNWDLGQAGPSFHEDESRYSYTCECLYFLANKEWLLHPLA